MKEVKTANLDNVVSLENVIKTVLYQVLESEILVTFLEDRSRKEIEEYIKTKSLNSLSLGFNNDLNIYISTYKLHDEITIHSVTGDYYWVFTGFDFETNWPSYGGMASDKVHALLSGWGVIFNEMNKIISPYKNIQLKTLYKTKEQHEVQEKVRRENLTRQRAFNLIPEHIKGLRVGNEVYFYFDNEEGVHAGNECEFEYSLKNKKFNCKAKLTSDNKMCMELTRTE